MTWTVSASGTMTTSIGSVDQTLATDSAAATYYFEVDTTNLVLGDILEMRIYTQTLVGGATRLAWKSVYGPGLAVLPVCASPPQPSDQGTSVAVRQTAGSPRSLTWKLLRQAAAVTSPESPYGTTVPTNGLTINASPTPGSAGSGNIISISPTGTILVNGSSPGGLNVIELYYTGHTCYQENSAGNWFAPITTSSPGVLVANPVPSITGITLSGNSFASGAAAGTVVGTITVAVNAATWSGTLALTGADAASFQIVGTSLETVTGAVGGNINIVATQSGLVGSPFTFPTTITATGGGLTAPSQAATAGFNTSVFNADFTATADVATTGGQTTGAKLYWAPSCTPSLTVTTGAGSGVTAGATGVLKINGWTGTSFGPNLQTTPPNATGSTTIGCWQHGYFEARMQFGATVAGSGAPGGIHEPSFWLKDTRNLTSAGSGSYHFAETDIMEYYPNGTAGATANLINTCHNWFDNASSYSDQFNTNTTNFDAAHQPSDGGWHTYGCLWTGNGTTGQVSFYFDNTLCTHQSGTQFYALNINGSPTAALTAMENAKMAIQISAAGSGWPVNFDWIRVWQGP